MKAEKDNTRFALAGAVIVAVTASLCCILPVIAVALGLTGFALRISLSVGGPLCSE
jgi:hypothetical protein